MPKLVIFSGAGLSAESGIGTFRDSNGLWANFDPMQVCNYTNWEDNFSLVHNFYNMRRAELANVKPNEMHLYLASLESRLKKLKSQKLESQKSESKKLDSKKPESKTPNTNKSKDDIKVFHITQNVDDLLERAGVQNALHVHGELTKLICLACQDVLDIGYHEFDMSPCKKCGYALMKPKVVFFYEPAPLYKPMYDIFSSLSADDAVLVIGTSGNVVDISRILYEAERGSCKISQCMIYFHR